MRQLSSAALASVAVLLAIGACAIDLPNIPIPPLPKLPELPKVGGSISSEGLNVTVGNQSFSANFSGVNLTQLQGMLPNVQVDPRIAAAIKAGLNGWVQFCPNSLIPKTDDPSDNCTSFRPVAFYETYSNGTIISNAINGARVQLLDLYDRLHIASLYNVSAPFCQGLADKSIACGANINGQALNYSLQPMSIPLLNGGQLHVDAWTFNDRGYISFDGRNYSVTPGTAKFDIRIANYTFQPNGSVLYLDLSSKVQGRDQNDVVVANTSSGDIAVNDQIIYLPRYAVQTAIGAAEWVWKVANVSRIVNGNNVLTRLAFEGPFVSLSYDPIVPNVAASIDNHTLVASAGDSTVRVQVSGAWDHSGVLAALAAIATLVMTLV